MLTYSCFIFYMFNVLHSLKKKNSLRPLSDEVPLHSLSTRMAALERICRECITSIRWLSPLLSRSAEKVPRIQHCQGSMCNCASENVIQFPPRILEHLESPKWVLWETSGNLAASKLLSNAKFARTLRCFSSMSSNLSMSSFRSAVFLVTFRGSTVKTSTTPGYEIFEFQQHLFQENLGPL